jgi:hypothetical protein
MTDLKIVLNTVVLSDLSEQKSKLYTDTRNRVHSSVFMRNEAKDYESVLLGHDAASLFKRFPTFGNIAVNLIFKYLEFLSNQSNLEDERTAIV